MDPIKRRILLGKRRYWYTSKIQNPWGLGGTVGVIGSGGALPTNMAVEQAMSGVATSFLGTGTAPNGKPCFYIGLNGTLSGANSLIIRMEGATYATASAGQAWGLDFDSYLSGGTASGLASVKAQIRDSATIVVAESSENGLSGTPTRLLAKGVVYGSATSIYPRLVVNNLNNGAAVDAVICICAPKLVKIAAVEGQEVAVNGSFASATGWTLDTETSIAAGLLNYMTTASRNVTQIGASFVNNGVYKVAAVISNYTSSSVKCRLGGNDAGENTFSLANGASTIYCAAGVTSEIRLRSNGATTLSLTGLSAKQVIAGSVPPNPILPPAGTMGDSSARL